MKLATLITFAQHRPEVTILGGITLFKKVVVGCGARLFASTSTSPSKAALSRHKTEEQVHPMLCIVVIMTSSFNKH